jgi:hypothetical protein
MSIPPVQQYRNDPWRADLTGSVALTDRVQVVARRETHLARQGFVDAPFGCLYRC